MRFPLKFLIHYQDTQKKRININVKLTESLEQWMLNGTFFLELVVNFIICS